MKSGKRREMWLPWTLATTGGITVGFSLALAPVVPLGPLGIPLGLLLAGSALGASQSFVLRRYRIRPRAWIVVTAAGFSFAFAGALLGLILPIGGPRIEPQGLLPGAALPLQYVLLPFLGTFVGGALGGALAGIVQSKVVCTGKDTRRSWVIASASAWGIGLTAFWGLFIGLTPLDPILHEWLRFFVAAALAGLLIGAISGPVVGRDLPSPAGSRSW